MKKYAKLFLIFILTLTIISCIDQIPIDIVENTNEYLIVNAELKDFESTHQIFIKINSEEATDFQANFPVNDAIVYVIENDDTRFDFAVVADKGTYQNKNLVLTEGSIYKLYIEYKGTLYSSSEEILPASIPIKELNTILSNELETNNAGNVVSTNFLNLFANIDTPKDEDVYLKHAVKGIYEFQEVGAQQNLNPLICYIDEIIDLDNLSLVTNTENGDNIFKNKLVLKRFVDFRFSFNYCMKVYQHRISENAYLFWKLIENEYSRTGDIFEKPPGVLRGNISETEDTEISAVGLFSVIAVDSMNILIKPTAAGSPRSACRTWPTRPDICYNCPSIPRSSLYRPECFQ